MQTIKHKRLNLIFIPHLEIFFRSLIIKFFHHFSLKFYIDIIIYILFKISLNLFSFRQLIINTSSIINFIFFLILRFLFMEMQLIFILILLLQFFLINIIFILEISIFIFFVIVNILIGIQYFIFQDIILKLFSK
ncbi:hypothetical protein PPERSA_11923 [Pseudocohnilembus persalinus]|uniref:Transmembrane protein n=1 Tax=Pseudocohnilembus persalinus TaxID=266149 RepID=A0A0V0QK55_PSEPJ|nr:hypothetical protein PPERSA_11923 [Pseudocohnilembus persalinus]|eukprot:KRX02583.1 hypothetical protein PPERSA_11923 [Pseudocohnilembus persalinus]